MENPNLRIILSVVLLVSLIVSTVFPDETSILIGFICGVILSCEFVHYIGKIIRYFNKRLFLKATSFVVLIASSIVIAPYVTLPLMAGIAIHLILKPKQHNFNIHPGECPIEDSEEKE